ncbi:MAG: CRISPR-associated endoribonuclease Cas6 [Fervidobacterium sp.]
MEIKPLNSGTFLEFPGKKIHGFLFNAMREANEKISEQVHKLSDLKPFTVSPIFGTRFGKPTIIEKDRTYKLRVTFLEDKIFELFTTKVMRDRILKNTLRVGPIEFLITKVIVDHTRSYWASVFSPKDYIENNTELRKEITLSFVTPTLFRIGDLHLSKPDAEKIYVGLLKKFNKYSDVKIDESIVEELKKIKIVKDDTYERKIFFENFYLQGFIGEVTFSINNSAGEGNENISKELLTTFNVLSEFAYYSGVGYKTTMGLGQTTIIKSGEDRRRNGDDKKG